jgi:hypothetical protein
MSRNKRRRPDGWVMRVTSSDGRGRSHTWLDASTFSTSRSGCTKAYSKRSGEDRQVVDKYMDNLRGDERQDAAAERRLVEVTTLAEPVKVCLVEVW